MNAHERAASDAADDLARAADAAVRIEARSRWLATFLTWLGVAFAAVTGLLGLAGSTPARVGVITATFLVCVAGALVWYHRQLAVPRQVARRFLPYFLATSSLYVVAVTVGVPLLPRHPGYWLPVAVVVGLPLLVAAWRERRS
jgi:hypothetical protein